MAEVMTALTAETRAAARAETLRRRCLERKGLLASPRQDHRHVAASLRASEGEASWPVRRGLLTRDLLAWFPFALDDQELLLGRMAPDRPEWQAEREEAKAWLAARYPDVFTPGQTGHCELDLSRLLALGLDGLRADVERRLAAAEGAQAETYQSFAHALDGLAVFIEHAADTAEEALPHASPERRAELALMAGACRRVAHQPPATFREALQLLWLAVLAVQHANYASLVQPGHLDRTLWPYYRDDLAAGRLKREGALELLEALYLLLNEQIADGLAIGVMVGGRDAQGRDLTNDLSYLCLEALRRTRLIPIGDPPLLRRPTLVFYGQNPMGLKAGITHAVLIQYFEAGQSCIPIEEMLGIDLPMRGIQAICAIVANDVALGKAGLYSINAVIPAGAAAANGNRNAAGYCLLERFPAFLGDFLVFV